MHLRSEPIARTGKGGLTLTDSSTELRLKAEIPSYRADVRDMVSRGILAGFSVEMHITAEDWPAADRRIIRAARLTGIGLVDRAAYGKATAAIAKRLKDGCTSTTSPWPHRPVSEIRRWCEQHLVVGDGPLAGSRFRVGGGGQGRAPIPAWRDVLDSMDDPEVEQCTLRGAVQSGKDRLPDRRRRSIT